MRWTGGPPAWEVEDGCLVAEKEDIVTADAFGDVQLYLEWNTPSNGNSGVKLHGWYEIQMLDSRGESPRRGGRQAPCTSSTRP